MKQAIFGFFSEFLLHFSIQCLAYFHPKIKKIKQGQAEILPVLKKLTPHKKRLWAHCASLGEYEQIRPLLELYQKENWQLIVSFFSPSGYEKRKNDPLLDAVIYLPLTQKKLNQVLDLLAIERIFWVKYEFWPHLLYGIQKRKIPIFLIATVFKKRSIFEHFLMGDLFKKLLKIFEKIFVQNPQSLWIAQNWGFRNVILSGDPRADRVLQIKKNRKNNLILEHFLQDKIDPILIVGSAWERELEIVANYTKTEKKYPIIIAPHEINPKNIAFFEEKLKHSTCKKYSQSDEKTDFSQTQILILDTIGILAEAYFYADWAFIGGGFRGKLHNILEAAVFEKPILLGEKIQNFPEALALIEEKAAFVIQNEIDLKNYLEKPKDFQAKAGKKAATWIEKQAGAAAKIKEDIKQ